jgi:hypothetical protein
VDLPVPQPLSNTIARNCKKDCGCNISAIVCIVVVTYQRQFVYHIPMNDDVRFVVMIKCTFALASLTSLDRLEDNN